MEPKDVIRHLLTKSASATTPGDALHYSQAALNAAKAAADLQMITGIEKSETK